MLEPGKRVYVELGRGLILFTVVILCGAVGFYVIEPSKGWTFLDALYMSVITASTVGFHEVHPLGHAGRIFAIIYVVFGVGTFLYVATMLATAFIAGELAGYWSYRRMEKELAHLADHQIICGFGRMGSQAAQDFKRQGRPVVVIDEDTAALQAAADAGYLVIHGDAGDDEILLKAGVDRASALVSTVADDASNLMVVLSARALNEKLFIVARVSAERNTSKLMAAGANRVLWPYGLGGRRMAQMALRPNVVEFLEFVMHDEELELWLEEVTIAIGSALEGAAIGSSAIRERTGAMLVAIRQRTGKMLVAPPPETVLNAGDIAVSLGTREQLQKLRAMSREGAAALQT